MPPGIADGPPEYASAAEIVGVAVDPASSIQAGAHEAASAPAPAPAPAPARGGRWGAVLARPAAWCGGIEVQQARDIVLDVDGSNHSSRAGGSLHFREDGSYRGSEHFRVDGSNRGSRASCAGHDQEDGLGQDGPYTDGAAPRATVEIEEPSALRYYDVGTYLRHLPKKLRGGLDTRLPVPSIWELFVGWFGAFVSILSISAMNEWVGQDADMVFIIGSFGASAVLLFGVVESKLSQPRNFLGGQVLSAITGLVVRTIITAPWIASPVGMSLALLVMQLTATTHPPGGATALIICCKAQLPKWNGWSYLVVVLIDCGIMQTVAFIVNTLDPKRLYPTFWW